MVRMGRPSRIPERGDVPVGIVARLLGLSAADFERLRPELERRGLPEPDPTTHLYTIEAVDRWRLRRHPHLFPELVSPPTAVDAGAVYRDRIAGMRKGSS
jgi:hypothetical protein